MHESDQQHGKSGYNFFARKGESPEENLLLKYQQVSIN